MSRVLKDERAEQRDDREFAERLDRALAKAPEFTLPESFAARVAAALPAAVPPAATPRYGLAALLGCGALLAVVLLLPAAHHEPPWVVSLLSVELVGIAVGAGSWRLRNA